MRIALTVSRATILPPIAAWIGTSNIWRGISSFELLGQRAAALRRLVARDDERKRIDRLAVEQDLELHQIALAIADHLVVERGVPLRA